MIILQLKNIGKKFTGSQEWAVKDFNLEVSQGEIVALLGESGCGKTTILRMIAGFEVPNTGSIVINGETVVGPGVLVEPQQRKVGIVFQDYALFPHKTVWENILFGLFRLKKDEAKEKAEMIMDLCGLTGLDKRYPHQLSGGQKQRVALARAMAPEPKIILFDEPFSNLDSMRKNKMRDDIRHIIHNTGATAVFVTHDTKDVLAIADKVSVMRQGTSLQTDAPQSVYNFPVNPYVADFFGKTNLIRARVTREGFHTHLGLIKAENLPHDNHSEVTLSIRPEQFHISPTHHGCCCGDVISERFLGEYTEVTCRVRSADGEFQEVVLYASPHFSCEDRKCYFRPKEGKINIME